MTTSRKPEIDWLLIQYHSCDFLPLLIFLISLFLPHLCGYTLISYGFSLIFFVVGCPIVFYVVRRKKMKIRAKMREREDRLN